MPRLAGLRAGVGSVALRLTRFERTTQGLFYRPNLWLVLALTGVSWCESLPPGAGLAQYLARMPWPVEGWLSHASLLGAAGVLLG